MMKVSRLSLLGYYCFFFVSATTKRRMVQAQPQPQQQQQQQQSPPPQQQEQPHCGLWMAPSTIPGGNLGMYAGGDDDNIIPRGTVIQREIAIPFMFRNWNGPLFFNPNLGDHNDGGLWFRYIWSGWVTDIEPFMVTNSQNQKVVFVPGIGCTINSLLDMKNVHSTHGSLYDTAGYSRADPSAGAFCPYHSSETTALIDIPAGSEIFADYGDEWIPQIPGAQITLDAVLDGAEDFIRDQYYPFVVQNHRTTNNNNMTDRLKEGLWNFTRDFPHPHPRIFTVLPRHTDWKTIQQQLERFFQQEEPLLKEMYHVTPEELWDDIQMPYYTERSSIIRHFIREQGKRSMEWLQQHGRCSDHMRPDTSTIPHAGRGAFATRDLPRGTTVGYSPLVHTGIKGSEVYKVPYTFEQDHSRDYEKYDLIYNYAFYHPHSTVMLSPYGSMVNFINHGGPERANVRIVWPDTELMAHLPHWLEQNATVLSNTLEKIGLSFDYVALRDIREGEEILLDYGPEWQAAWDEHVRNWVPPRDADTYVHSTQWKEDTLRTVDELQQNPYPPNLHTICLPSYHFRPDKGSYYYLVPDRDYVDRIPCRVLERKNHPTIPDAPEVYTVELLFDKGPKIVLNFPRNAVTLTDIIMSQDWHLPNTFRHPIKIPDDIFPKTWKNRLQNTGASDESDIATNDDTEQEVANSGSAEESVTKDEL